MGENGETQPDKEAEGAATAAEKAAEIIGKHSAAGFFAGRTADEVRTAQAELAEIIERVEKKIKPKEK